VKVNLITHSNKRTKAVTLITPMLPRKVEAAMGVVGMFRQTNALASSAVAEFSTAKPKLTHGEERSYESALAVLTTYFNGEMNYEEECQVVETDCPQLTPDDGTVQ
jgi:hypothetical protein